jgi:hypothetical protein
MDPENVAVTFSIVVANNTHRNHAGFSEEWNFTIDRYIFNRVNEDEVRVSFTFDAVLKKYDEEHGMIEECPSEYLPEFQKYEEEIETILDLVSLKSGVGIRIKEESFLFSAATCKDNEFQNRHLVKVADTKELFSQFSSPQTENDKKLKLALRLYRQSLLSNDPRDKMIMLYSALEQLFSEENKPLLEGEELKQVVKVLQEVTISEEKKKVIMERIRDIRKSPKTMIVENLEIAYGKERVSEEEKVRIVTNWNKYRSKIAHGKIVQKRDEDFDIAVSEVDSMIDSILERSIEDRRKQGESDDSK